MSEISHPAPQPPEEGKKEKRLSRDALLTEISKLVWDTDFTDPKVEEEARPDILSLYKQIVTENSAVVISEDKELRTVINEAARVIGAVSFITSPAEKVQDEVVIPESQVKNLIALVSFLSQGRHFNFKTGDLSLIAHPGEAVYTPAGAFANTETRSHEYNEFVVKGNLEKVRTMWDIENKGLLIRALYILSATVRTPDELEEALKEYTFSMSELDPSAYITPKAGELPAYASNICGNAVGMLEVIQNLGLHQRDEFKHFTDNLVTVMYRSLTPAGAAMTTAEVMEDIRSVYSYSVLYNLDIVGDLDVATPVQRLARARSGRTLPVIGFNGVTVAAMSREQSNRSSMQVVTDVMEANPYAPTDELNQRIQQAHFNEGVIAHDKLTIPRRFISSVRAEVQQTFPENKGVANTSETCTRALQEITRFFETDADFLQLMTNKGKEVVASLSSRQFAGGKGLANWEQLQRDPLFSWLGSFSDETAEVLEIWAQENPGTMYLFLKTMVYRLTGEMSRAEPENKFLFDHEYGPKGEVRAADMQTLIQKIRLCFNKEASLAPPTQRERLVWAQNKQRESCKALLTPEARLAMRDKLNELRNKPGILGLPMRADLKVDQLTYARILSLISGFVIALNSFYHINVAFVDNRWGPYGPENLALQAVDSNPFFIGSSEMEFFSELYERFSSNEPDLSAKSVDTMPDGLDAEALENAPVFRLATLIHYPEALQDGEEVFFLPLNTHSERLHPEHTTKSNSMEGRMSTILLAELHGEVEFTDDLDMLDLEQYKRSDTVIFRLEKDYLTNVLHMPKGYVLEKVFFETPRQGDPSQVVDTADKIFTDVRGGLLTADDSALPLEAVVVARKGPQSNLGRFQVLYPETSTSLYTLDMNPDFDKAYAINDLMKDGALKALHRSFIDEYKALVEEKGADHPVDPARASDLIIEYQMRLGMYVDDNVRYSLDYNASETATLHLLDVEGLTDDQNRMNLLVDNQHLISQSVKPGGYCLVWSNVTSDFFTSVLGDNTMITQNLGYHGYAFEGTDILAQIGHATNTVYLPDGRRLEIDNTPRAEEGAQLPDVLNGIDKEKADRFLGREAAGPSAAELTADFIEDYGTAAAGLFLLGSLFAMARRYGLAEKAQTAFLDARAKLLVKIAPELQQAEREELLPAFVDYVVAQPNLADKRISLQHIVRVLSYDGSGTGGASPLLSRPEIREYVESEGFSLPDVDALLPDLPPTDGHLRQAAEHVMLMLKHAAIKRRQPVEELAAQLDVVPVDERMIPDGDEVPDIDDQAYAEAIRILKAREMVILPDTAAKDEEELHSILYHAVTYGHIPVQSRALIQALSVGITGRRLFEKGPPNELKPVQT